MKSSNGRHLFLSRPQIAQAREHLVGRTRNHGGQTTRHPGRTDRIDSPCDIFPRRARIIKIDTRESIHLNIDKARRDPGQVATDKRPHRLDRIPKLNLHRFVRSDINSATRFIHNSSTAFSQPPRLNPNKPLKKNPVEIGAQHHGIRVTTGRRIGWRVIPAADLGGGGRGRDRARSRLVRKMMQTPQAWPM